MTFRIGFYGLGPRSLFGNQVITEIGLAVGASMYPQSGGNQALADLLKVFESGPNRQISAAEAGRHTVKVFGYSYGGVAAIVFA